MPNLEIQQNILSDRARFGEIWQKGPDAVPAGAEAENW